MCGDTGRVSPAEWARALVDMPQVEAGAELLPHALLRIPHTRRRAHGPVEVREQPTAKLLLSLPRLVGRELSTHMRCAGGGRTLGERKAGG